MRAFRQEFDYIYQALLRHGVASSDAEDVAQDVFLVMWRRWTAYDGGRPLRPWLAGIAYRVASDHRKRRRREVPHGQLEAEDVTPPADEQLAARRAQVLVLEALARLPEHHRSVVVLHELEGLRAQQIAELMRIPLATVYSRIRRARLAFADEVARLASQPIRSRHAALLVTPGLLEMERARAPSSPIAPGTGLGTLGIKIAFVAAAAVVVLLLGPGAWRAPVAANLRSSPPIELARAGTQAPDSSPVRQHGPSALPALLSGAATAELDRDLVGYWRFDDGPGTARAFDSSPLANHCLLRNLDPDTAWVDGAHGGAVVLDGNGWLECPQPALPTGTSPPPLSIAAWTRRKTLKANRNAALASREMGASNEDYFFFGFNTYKLKVTSHAWIGHTSSSLPETIDHWVHVAFTHAPDGATRLYVNGLEVARSNVRHRRLLGGRNPLMIGAGYNSRRGREVGQRFIGAIDDLIIYRRVLSEEEIAALAGGAQPPPGASQAHDISR